MLGGFFHNVGHTAASVVHKTEETIAEVLGLFSKSDKHILDEVYATHVHADESFDDDSLFIIVENILKHATQSVDKIVQGNKVHVEEIEEKTPSANFSVPLCTLKGISSEMCCKPLGEDIAHKTAMAILHKLSSYSWEAKASLTLAAFAMEYGEFWLLAELRDSDRLAKSIGILKRVPILLKLKNLLKHSKAILELNNLIKATLQVIDCIDQLNRLSRYDTKDVPDLSIVLEHIPVDVYWIIITVVACATKVTILTNDEDKEFDLAPYSQKLHYVLNKLKTQLITCRAQADEADAYKRIKKLFQTPTEVMEVFKGLIFSKIGNVQPLIDGSTKHTVSIDILRKQNVLLFISTLDISDDDISILKPVHEFIKKQNHFKIVWFPIVEQWTELLRKKFEILKNKMPWFTVQYSVAPIAGIKFIKEDWSFKGKPTLVVLSPKGKVEHSNAFHMIKLWGVKAFPFTKEAEEKISQSQKWFSSVTDGIHSIHPSLSTWVKEDKYIFFYGGKDNDWIQQFTKKATALVNDITFKEAKISIELVCVGKGSKGEDDHDILGRFWSGIESLFFTKVHKQGDIVTQEIQKLLSYKNENGWAVLTKGPSVLVSGPGVSVLKVVEDFEKWKDQVKVNGFEFGFKIHFDKIYSVTRPCCRLDVPGSTGKVPETMKCPDCERLMETYISYKCCHIDGSTAHH